MTPLDEGKIVHIPEASVSHPKMFFFSLVFCYIQCCHPKWYWWLRFMPWRVRHPNRQDGHSPFICRNRRSCGMLLPRLACASVV